VLEVSGLRAGYGPVEVLHGVDLAIGKREIVALLGSNGAGKSTLNNNLSGLYRPFAGRVSLDGEEIAGEAPDRIVGRGLVQVPEGRRVFPNLSVRENLELGSYRRGRTRRQQNLARVSTLFPRLAERLRQRAGTLSGGEQQMLAIGRALMAEPRLLILDEPSLGLSPLLVEEMFALIGRLREDSRSFSSSRTSCNPLRSPTAPTCWRTVRWRSRARARSFSTTPSSSALISDCEQGRTHARATFARGQAMIDPVTLAVLQGRLEQLADEMDATLFRSAFNPIIAEAHDASHGLYHRETGATLVQGKSGLPIFVGVMSFAVKAVIDKAGAKASLPMATSTSSTIPMTAARTSRTSSWCGLISGRDGSSAISPRSGTGTTSAATCPAIIIRSRPRASRRAC